MHCIFFCDVYGAGMESNDLQARLKRMAMQQKDFAARCGVTIRTAHHGLKSGLWQYRTIIELLETLTFEQRRDWLDQQRGGESDDE